MRVRVHDLGATEQAVAKYGEALQKAGCHWFKVYRRDGNEKEVLWLMEFGSYEAFEKSSEGMEEDFVSLINPASEWDDAVWKLALERG